MEVKSRVRAGDRGSASEPAARSTIPVAITAAGASSRMGRPKALLPWRGGTMLEAMASTARRAGLRSVAVVGGADGEQVLEVARRLGVAALWNADHATGRWSSILVAARWASERAESRGGCPSLLLWPVDCPGVDPATLSAIGRAAEARPRANIVPIHSGRGGHPVALCADTLAEILASARDANLRDLIDRAPDGCLRIPVADPAILDNLNTPADYRRFLRSRREASVGEPPND